MESSYDIIASLADLRGITGRESAVGQAAAELLRPFAPDAVYRDGSVTAHIGQNGAKTTLLLCAHLDQVGFVVTDITPDGFLRIGSVGGIDHRLLLGQPVLVNGSEPLSGVISILPPHLLKGEQAVPEDAQLCVDLGFSSAEELAGKVSRGDAVYYGTTCKKLLGSRMTGSALDDRCCVAAVIMAAEAISKKDDLPCNVTIVFSGQEERSGRGAKLAAYNERPDFAIAVDVTFGMANGEDPAECMELGKGPAIGISPVLSPELSDALIETAKAAQIPYQLEVMSGSTGTDADSLALAPSGCAAGTVSVPLRYMHTPVEVIDTADIAQTAALLAAYAERCGAK
ncbi:MAG: M20/M25/M40 family metallo-hydrolase [Oscillospiraceae bacterium]|nr:M20/M25/M40 family metallo-hydrolase [Oscillospiraceae bacterium]